MNNDQKYYVINYVMMNSFEGGIWGVFGGYLGVFGVCSGVFGGICGLRVITFSIQAAEPFSCFIILKYTEIWVGPTGLGLPPLHRGITSSRILQEGAARRWVEYAF